MSVATSALSLQRPSTLRDALEMMRDAPLSPIAGCTDVFVSLHFDTAAERRYIDLWPLAELRGIGGDRHALRIGALTTFAELRTSSVIRRRVPMLAAAASDVGGRQIQHRGTVGGNIANASPAGDALPVLAACDAVVVLESLEAERRVPLTAFYTGYRQTVRRSDEIITAVEVPAIKGRQYWRKVGTRRAQAISKVMCAGVRGDTVRLAFGSVGPSVLRARHAEDVLTRGGTVEEAQEALRHDIAPIDDVRSTADYRRAVAANLIADFWAESRRRGR